MAFRFLLPQVIIYYIPDADEMMRKASFYSWMFFVIGVSCIVSSGTAQVRLGYQHAFDLWLL